MQAIIAQLVAELAPGTLQLATPVQHVAVGTVALVGGTTLPASAIVVATDPTAAARLLPGFTAPPGLAVTTVHLAGPDPLPWDGRWLLLDGDDEGVATAFAVPSAITAGYAPPGQHLISATVLPGAGGSDPAAAVLAQLQRWFGPGHRWEVLHVDRLPYAKPRQQPHDPVPAAPLWSRGIYLCGDATDDASLDGAMRSGRRAAEAILAA